MNSRGFTMVELMVATVVTGILILVIMGFFINSFVNFTISSARGDLLREAQLTLDAVTQEIRLSSNAYETATLLDENEPTAGWVGDENVLIVGTAATDADNNILFVDSMGYTSYKNNNIYFVQDNTLYRRTLAANVDDNARRTTCPEAASTAACPADTVLANDVAGFTIRYYDGNDAEVPPNQARSIELTLDLAVTKYGRDLETTYTTRTVFRNE